MKKIISIDDLLQYLGEIDHGNTSTQEVIIKKITHDGAFPEEVLPFRDFGAQYVEKEIPQPLFIDAHNRTYKRFLNEGEYYYLPISYESKFEIYQEQNLDNLIELTIPGEIYRGGYSFYINEKDELVASVEVTTLSNLNDYIAYQASTFSYVESYPVLNYPYTSVYGASVKENITVVPNIKSDLIHRFPILSKTFEERKGYCLSYYYKKDSAEIRTIPLAEEDHQFIALRIYFKSITAVLSFLNNTIFNSFNEYTDYQSKYRYLFLTTLTSRVAKEFNNGGNNNKKEALVYHLPQPLYYDFEWESLWVIIETLAKGYITNVGINEEDLIIKTLRILYFRYTHKRKVDTIDGSKVLEEKNVGSIERNTLFIKNLLNRKVENEILLYKLIKGLNGEQFKTYINFIWKIWKSSAFAIIDPAENKEVTITDKSPVLIDYRSDSTLGFLKDNATIKWDGKQTQLDISVTLKTGEYEEKTIEREDGEQKILVEKQEKHQYQHHPFSPIVLVNSHNPKFFVKEDDEKENLLFTKIPSFMLFANQEVAYWQNIIKGSEYAVDIVTTVSGVGNILKVGRLYKVLKGGKTIFFKTKQATKVIAGVKAAVGVIEVSSGTVNTLLKLTELDDTELGKTTSKYLFYLEMLSLAGEATVFLKNKLSATAKELVENPKFTKSLDDLVKKGEIDEILKTRVLEELSGVKLLETTLNISPFIAKFSKKLPKALDNAPLELKKVEDLILKKVGKIKEIEDQWEYAFIWNKQGHFKTSRPFTSKSNDEVLISRAFGEKEKMTIDRIRMLKGAIITHNHPNFSRFSDDDIKIFLKYGLNELRAINLDGIVYSLKLKKGKSFEKNEIIKIYDSLAVAREKFVLENIMKTQYFEEKVKFQLKYERFEEEYILSKIKDKIEYIIYK